MPENGNSNANAPLANLRETYQPDIQQRTYSPTGANGNYQPLVPSSVGAGRQPTPPTGGSGVPAGRNNSGSSGAPPGNGSSK